MSMAAEAVAKDMRPPGDVMSGRCVTLFTCGG